ncbi:MAG: UDP-N-acetylmuramoyl-L-alanyl-D-glutamate--2,6-diaminopimelate ligase [Bacteriovoracia bacterium]
MNLFELFQDVPRDALVKGEVPPDRRSSRVLHVTADSRQVKAGTVFVATPGVSADGHAFLPAAAAQGALLLVGERSPPSGLSTPYLQVTDSRQVLGLLASAFYGHPSRAMKLIGVTGTSGKTTTTYLIESILAAAGERPGLIGTVEFRTPKGALPSTHTTPGAVELQKLLAEMRDAGCLSVVMEVSSHALKQARTYGIAFDVVAFTNLSPEHLDYHPDMEDYFQSKARLFGEYMNFSAEAGKQPRAVVNARDDFGGRLLKMAKNATPAPETGGLRFDLRGVRGKVGGVAIESPLLGDFNAQNIAVAVGVAHALAVAPATIAEGVRRLSGVPGRLEPVPNGRGFTVLVDYAHKPDALEKVLTMLRTLKGNGKLITVFGCGGDRDRQKRPRMGEIAARLSDQVVVTSDNPRTEDPLVIIREIEGGIGDADARARVKVEADRRAAITQALTAAKGGDVVLIAGKGHEDYQVLGTRKIHFSDREVVLDILK